MIGGFDAVVKGSQIGLLLADLSLLGAILIRLPLTKPRSPARAMPNNASSSVSIRTSIHTRAVLSGTALSLLRRCSRWPQEKTMTPRSDLWSGDAIANCQLRIWPSNEHKVILAVTVGFLIELEPYLELRAP